MLPNYEEEYLSELFDKMGASYEVVNMVSSLGFSNLWRKRCVANLKLMKGDVVADLMSGSGECWAHILSRISPSGTLTSVDFSKVMCQRQIDRLRRSNHLKVNVHQENALTLSLGDSSVDCVVSAFGLKTFNQDQLASFASEIVRVLRTSGRFSFLEISVPNNPVFRRLFLFYISKLIPLIGRVFLGDIECYKMLGVYTQSFGTCVNVLPIFEQAGLNCEVRSHFLGCATSLVGTKPL